ncbi:hypothetical protein ES708_20347 [subsurface metagenome]
MVTYTAATADDYIVGGSPVTFSPAVTNPETGGDDKATPTVKTSDPGTKATLTTHSGTGWEISYEAVILGAAGGGISVVYIKDTEHPVLAVSVNGTAISVELLDDGANITSTADLVVAAINADPEASALVVASTLVSGLMVDGGPFSLTGGSNPLADYSCDVTPLTLTIKEFVVTALPAANTSATFTAYTITFTPLELIVADTGTIIITFPEGYDISQLAMSEITMTVGGSTYNPKSTTPNPATRTVTITANLEMLADTEVVVSLINNHVKNPPTSGDYPINVLTSGGDEASDEVTIIPASFSVAPSGAVKAGEAFAVTVTAQNADSGTDTGYAGGHFIDFVSSSADPDAIIPGFELILFTTGEGTSPANFILTDATETPTISAEDATTGITGISTEITINPAVGLASLEITGEPTGVTAGEAFASLAEDITVTAYDAKGNVKTDYEGTVTWSSSDGNAELPDPYPFTAEDAGVKVFPGSEFILKTAGATQTITVADGSISDISGDITVTAALATKLEVAASPSVIRANSLDTSEITVTALDDFGNTDLTYSESITIKSSLATIGTAALQFEGATGVVTTTLTSILDEVGTALIKVTSEFATVTTNVELLPVIGINTIDVTVDKGTILNNGVDVRTITATYLDSESEVVTAAAGADYTVTFTHAYGDNVTLDPADGVVVPVAGVATVTLTTTLASPNTIQVTATGTGETDVLTPIDVTEGTFPITLSQGWNLLSTPIKLDAGSDSVEQILGESVANIELSYRWDAVSEKWAIPTGYELSPLEAIYLKVKADASATAEFIPSQELSWLPSRQLQPGLNLIGPAPAFDLEAGVFPDTPLDEALASIETAGEFWGYCMVVSPAHNQPDWAYALGGQIQDLLPFKGYWVVMDNADTMYGFSTTPIPE